VSTRLNIFREDSDLRIDLGANFHQSLVDMLTVGNVIWVFYDFLVGIPVFMGLVRDEIGGGKPNPYGRPASQFGQNGKIVLATA